MGGLLSYLWPGPSSAEFINDPKLDEVDAATGLTERQKRVIRETWEIIKKDVPQNAIDLFIMIFKAQPSFQSKFKGMEKLTFEEMKTSKRLQAHGTNVLFSFTSMVDNLDDVECLKELLLKVGRNHIKRKLTQEHFECVGAIVLDFLEVKVGPDFTPFARTAWTSAVKVINSIIGMGLAEKDEE